jgi:hypothetical protein
LQNPAGRKRWYRNTSAMMARPAPAVRAHRAARRHRTFANGKIPAARSADRIAGPGSILRPRAAKIIGPLGLALIAGSSDLVSPTATIDALFPAFLFLAFWYGQAALMFLLLGFETKGRSIEEINRALDTRAFVALDPVRMPAQ